MTGNTLETYIRRKIGEKDASFWTQPDIRTKIDEGSKQVARDTKCVKSSFTKTTVADTATYTFTDETEFLSESSEGVWISDGTDWTEVKVRSIDFLNKEYIDWKNATSEQPLYCFIDRQAKSITLYPPPSSTYEGNNYLQIYTIELTPNISNWDAELILPADLHLAVAYWAIGDAKEDRLDYDVAGYWGNKYDKKVHKGAMDTLHHPARKIQVRPSLSLKSRRRSYYR